MKLKNTGTTIINIGKVVILPDEIGEVTDKAYENNETVEYLIKTKRLALVKEKKKPVVEKAKAPTESSKKEQE